jgi:hypothetical protein
MSSFTAKIRLTYKSADNEDGPVNLSFSPDYADGRNAEWAAATPSLSLAMSVKQELAARLDVGTSFTLTFDPDLPEADIV